MIAMSAGNHAQAVAYHAARLGIPATIVMPVTTPFVKVAATRALWRRGRARRRDGRRGAGALPRSMRSERGLTLVHPYDDPPIIAGQGTIALEMLEDVPDLDMLVIPIGGGGLIAGNAIAARGVQARRSRSSARRPRSIRRCGMRCTASSRPIGGPTLAEGIAVKNVGTLTLPIVRDLVSDIVLVDEAHLERAVNAYLTLQKTMAEGAGAAGLAAMLAEPERFGGRKVGLILCGGNIDPRILASIMVRELEREDRIVSFRLTIPDRPGVLGPDRDAARRARRQHPRGRSPPAVSRRAGQGREARRHRRDARRRARRGDLARARGRRLSAGAHRARRGDGVRLTRQPTIAPACRGFAARWTTGSLLWIDEQIDAGFDDLISASVRGSYAGARGLPLMGIQPGKFDGCARSSGPRAFQRLELHYPRWSSLMKSTRGRRRAFDRHLLDRDRVACGIVDGLADEFRLAHSFNSRLSKVRWKQGSPASESA